MVLAIENYKIWKIDDFTTTLQFITHVFQLIVKVLFCVIKAVSKS